MASIYVFDAYGTLFDVHAAIGRFRSDAGPDADRMSDIWRTKQLEYTWTLTLAGRDAAKPQFTDHCFTGDYPTTLTDLGAQDASPRQLSLLAEAI